MRIIIFVLIPLLFVTPSHSQTTKAPLKYPSILWEISSKKTNKKSYLFGTYHISKKNVFHLSDSFYVAIRNSDVIATESLESNWEEEFYQQPLYAPDDLGEIRRWRGEYFPGYYSDFNINSFGFSNYEKELEKKFDEYPSIIKGIISRVYNEDYSEDTYLDHYIYKLGRRLEKLSVGLENFRESNDIILQGAINRELEPRSAANSFDNRIDGDDLLDAYIRNNLDELDSLSILSDGSEAYREKMLYERNMVQAKQIDSFIRNNKTIFAAVGCAHLPGKKGVIEMLRAMGYEMRPILATQKSEGTNKQYKEQIVKKEFSRQVSPDGLISVKTPGKLYSFSKKSYEEFLQSVDVDNDAYFLISRISTNYHLAGDNEQKVLKKLDSLFYDNIPGDILEKKPIEKNGYRGYEITSKKKTGMYQKFQVFVTPAEIIYFKSYSTETYFQKSGYVDTFFQSIQLAPLKKPATEKTFSPAPYGGFAANFPTDPAVIKNFGNGISRWEYFAADSSGDYTVLKSWRYDSDFGGDDTLDLQLMRLSYQTSYFIDSCISSKPATINGRAALVCSFLHTDKSISKVCFTLRGNECYAAIGHAAKDNSRLDNFIHSFSLTPYKMPSPVNQVDTFYNFSVKSPFFYDKETIGHRKAADEWINRYRGNKEFATKIKNEFSPGTNILFNDTTGFRLTMAANYAFNKATVDQFADSVYFRRVNYDTSMISKTDFVMMVDGLRGQYFIKSFSKKTMPDSSIEKTAIVKWQASSRLKLIRIIELPGRDQLRKIGFQYDSLDQDHPLINVAASYRVNDLGKIPRKEDISSMLAKATRNDTSIGKNFYTDLSKALYKADEKYLPEIIHAIRSLPTGIRDYLRIKERMVSSLQYFPAQESTDFLATYFTEQEDTFMIRKACLNALFVQQTAYSLNKGMKLLAEDPDVDYTTGDSPLAVYIRAANSKKGKPEDQNSRESFAVLGKNAEQIAALLNESAWREDAIRTLLLLQEKGLLKKKALKTYVPKLLQYAKKEVRRSMQSDMRRIEAAKQVTDDDNSSTSFISDFTGSSDRESTNSLLIPVCNLLLPYRSTVPEVDGLFEKIRQLDTSNSVKKSFLLFSIKKGVEFPDSILNKYITNETKAYSFIREASRDSVDLCSRYSIGPASLARLMVLKDNTPGSRSFIDSFVLVQTDTVLQRDSIHYIYTYKTWQKKDRKNSAWVICKITRSGRTGKYIFRDFLKASSSYSVLPAKLSAKDKEQLNLRILYDEYRPLNRYFNGVKGYSNFSIQYP